MNNIEPIRDDQADDHTGFTMLDMAQHVPADDLKDHWDRVWRTKAVEDVSWFQTSAEP